MVNQVITPSTQNDDPSNFLRSIVFSFSSTLRNSVATFQCQMDGVLSSLLLCLPSVRHPRLPSILLKITSRSGACCACSMVSPQGLHSGISQPSQSLPLKKRQWKTFHYSPPSATAISASHKETVTNESFHNVFVAKPKHLDCRRLMMSHWCQKNSLVLATVLSFPEKPFHLVLLISWFKNSLQITRCLSSVRHWIPFSPAS